MARSDTSPGPDGLAVIDKEPGWTSHDVVAKARGLLGTRKVGHSGTLDPDATGVLLLGVGRVTRLLRFLTDLPKSYVGEIVLGSETTTLDDSGDVTATYDMSGVTLAQVQEVALGFVGPIEQVPPMVSAVKIGGRRLHEIAREGREIERPPRPVTVHRLSVAASAENPDGVFRLEVDCSSGTYIRTLAADIGTALGGGAHLRRLRRTAIGSFGLADAKPLDEIELLAPSMALRDYTSVVVDQEGAVAVGHGKPLTGLDIAEDEVGPWAVLDEAGVLLGVFVRKGPDVLKPLVVIPR